MKVFQLVHIHNIHNIGMTPVFQNTGVIPVLGKIFYDPVLTPSALWYFGTLKKWLKIVKS